VCPIASAAYGAACAVHVRASALCVRVCREGRSWNKGAILRSTVDYVRRLQSQRWSLYEMLATNRRLEQRNQQLRDEVKVCLQLPVTAM